MGLHDLGHIFSPLGASVSSSMKLGCFPITHAVLGLLEGALGVVAEELEGQLVGSVPFPIFLKAALLSYTAIAGIHLRSHLARNPAAKIFKALAFKV